MAVLMRDREAKTMTVIKEGDMVLLVIGEGEDGNFKRFILRPSLRKKILIELFKTVVG